MDSEDPSPQMASPLAATGNATEVNSNAGLMNDDEAEPICRREGCEALSRAISSTLGAVTSEFDSRADGVSRSQDELCLKIDRLTGGNEFIASLVEDDEICEWCYRTIGQILYVEVEENDAPSNVVEVVAPQVHETFSLEERIEGGPMIPTELDKLLEDAPLSFIMQNAAKITSVRRRVSALNLVLKSIQRRLDNIDRMLSTSLAEVKRPLDIVKAS